MLEVTSYSNSTCTGGLPNHNVKEINHQNSDQQDEDKQQRVTKHQTKHVTKHVIEHKAKYEVKHKAKATRGRSVKPEVLPSVSQVSNGSDMYKTNNVTPSFIISSSPTYSPCSSPEHDWVHLIQRFYPWETLSANLVTCAKVNDNRKLPSYSSAQVNRVVLHANALNTQTSTSRQNPAAVLEHTISDNTACNSESVILHYSNESLEPPVKKSKMDSLLFSE